MFYSEQKKQITTYNRRTFFLFLLKLSLFTAVGWRIYNIQILDSSKYETLSKKNQIDLEIIFPLRGKIFDRNNILIADNEKVYDVYLIPENTKSINNTLNSLSKSTSPLSSGLPASGFSESPVGLSSTVLLSAGRLALVSSSCDV